jgi:protein TonB
MTPVRLPFTREHIPRILCFTAVAAFHILLLCFLIFEIEIPEIIPPSPIQVMKLTDIQEYAPPPPPPPPPVVLPVQQSVAETIAEEVIEVEELEPEVTEAAAPTVIPPAPQSTGSTGPDYFPQHMISVLPQFDQKELLRRTVYPPIAQRSNIEGSVVLELFVDRDGYVRNIVVLKETPEGRGFAEAAIKAFQGYRALTPAQANGEYVAARYRRPVRFTLK